MRTELMLQVAARAEVSLRTLNDRSKLMHELLDAGEANPDVYLDIIDAVLASSSTKYKDLERILQDGRSAWTVAADGRSLQERVDPTAQLAIERTTRPADVVSEELRHAWSKAFGRDADASDAWDHAIKAVEAALIPVVVPRQDKPHLGHVLGTLDRQGEGFVLRLGDTDGIETLVSMLRLLWPNPDRHASPAGRHAPSDEEAKGIVHLAIAIVQWVREGLLERV